MRRFLKGLADLIFPPRCTGCEKLIDAAEDASFCDRCLSRIRFITSPICPCCGIPLVAGEDDHLCADCLVARPPYETARAVARYESVMLEAIHSFKYAGKTAAGEALGKMMAAYEYPGFCITDYSLIIPVPLHPRRLRERGFNQAVILAREVAKRFPIELDFLTLKRKALTETQVSLGRQQRRENVRGAFGVDRRQKIERQRILLVDDVYTTGSTVRECAQVLKQNGAAEVAVLTLAMAV